MNDQWNIAGGKFSNGYPAITSHYGYHMTVWHVLLALNGQDADLSHFEVDGTVCFAVPSLAVVRGAGLMYCLTLSRATLLNAGHTFF